MQFWLIDIISTWINDRCSNSNSFDYLDYIYIYISFTRASCIWVLKSLLNYEIGRVSTRDHFLWSRRVFRHFKIAEIEKNCRSASVKQDELTWQSMKSIYIFDITKILESLAIMFITMAVIVRFSTSSLMGSLADRISLDVSLLRRVGSKLCRLEYHEGKQLVRRLSA